MRFHLSYTFLLLLLLSGCGEEQHIEPQSNLLVYRPDGFPNYTIPDDNPVTKASVDLGRRLFYDPILSRDSSLSCGSCHEQAFGFTDEGRDWSLGVDNLPGTKNASQIINLMWGSEFFWDGRAANLEAQALMPIEDDLEMDEDLANVVAKLQRHGTYPKLFRQVFGSEVVTEGRLGKAIASFERTLISGNSRYHRYLYDKAGGTLSEAEERGRVLFFGEKAECFHCHIDVTFTDNSFRNNGLESTFPPKHEGRFAVTGEITDMGKFKTPTLINIAQTAPYMHDGRFETLEEVINHYSNNIKYSAFLDPLIRPNGFQLSQQETDDLVAFLHTLTDEEFLTNPDFRNPFQ